LIGYACTSTDKPTLVSVQVSGVHWRLRKKLSKVLKF